MGSISEGRRVAGELGQPRVCDGGPVSVTISYEPNDWANGNNTPVQWKIEGEGHVTDFKNKNPANKGSEIIADGDDVKKYKVPNARWFSSGNDCANDSSYTITGMLGPYTVEDMPKLTVSAKPKSLANRKDGWKNDGCMNGGAFFNRAFSGEPNFEVTYNKEKKQYEARFKDLGTFKRDVLYDAQVSFAYNASQYYPLLMMEEEEHKKQAEDPKHPICGNYWKVESVLATFNRARVRTGSTEQFALTAVKREWAYAVKSVSEGDSGEIWRERTANRLALEKEAKDNVSAAFGSMFRFKYECTYGR